MLSSNFDGFWFTTCHSLIKRVSSLSQIGKLLLLVKGFLAGFVYKSGKVVAIKGIFISKTIKEVLLLREFLLVSSISHFQIIVAIKGSFANKLKQRSVAIKGVFAGFVYKSFLNHCCY